MQDRLQWWHPRARRLAATAALALGVLTVVGAVPPPPQRRVALLIDVIPVQLAQSAGAGLVFAGVGLILVGGGLRRGYRTAYVATLALLAFATMSHLARSIQIGHAAVDLALAAVLLGRHADFAVRPRPAALKRTILRGALAGAFAVGGSIALGVIFGGRQRAGQSARAAVEYLAGDPDLPLPADRFVAPALVALGIMVLAVVTFSLFAPREAPPLTRAGRSRDRERARAIVAAHGGGTLDYFALRDDKQWFFHGDGVVAYAVRGGVCLVSPDPIGPEDGRERLWAAFTAFVKSNGWSLAVMAAGPSWLPIYRAGGLHSLYVGDEAIVDCRTFTLDGHTGKSLRGARNRLAKAGCTVSFHDPAHLDASLAAALTAIVGESRHGTAERGFSMTLSRLFDPLDTGLLLTVAHAADGTPIGFIQWVPAPDIDGWSLDVMRRSADPATPNGVTDFMIMATIDRCRDEGRAGLALNFAIMRRVLADEDPSRPRAAAQFALRRLSKRAQIESLWRFNQKYQPQWRPRYVVLDAPEYAASQGLVIAGAEGVDEIPLVGRLLTTGRAR